MILKANHSALLIVAILALFTSCKSTSGLHKGTPPSRTKDEVLKALNLHNIDFTWFAAKANAHFESESLSGSGSLQLRIRKDSLVWMTGKKFSIEGFRSIINKDSFYLVNRIEKYYHAEANRSLTRTFGIDLSFEDVQHLLAGNMFLPGKNDSTYFSKTDGGFYYYSGDIDFDKHGKTFKIFGSLDSCVFCPRLATATPLYSYESYYIKKDGRNWIVNTNYQKNLTFRKQ